MTSCEFTHETLIDHFNRQIDTYGPSIDALQWYSSFTQQERYKVICNEILDEECSLLDLGCGCGDLYDYIKTNNYSINYTGIDLSAKMITSAQRAYPSGTFTCLDLETICINNKYDYIVASGVFNLKLEDHHDYMINTLKIMLENARKKVIVKFLSHKVSKWSKSNMFVYTNPEIIVSKFKNTQYKIINKYLPNDITLVLYK